MLISGTFYSDIRLRKNERRSEVVYFPNIISIWPCACWLGKASKFNLNLSESAAATDRIKTALSSLQVYNT